MKPILIHTSSMQLKPEYQELFSYVIKFDEDSVADGIDPEEAKVKAAALVGSISELVESDFKDGEVVMIIFAIHDHDRKLLKNASMLGTIPVFLKLENPEKKFIFDISYHKVDDVRKMIDDLAPEYKKALSNSVFIFNPGKESDISFFDGSFYKGINVESLDDYELSVIRRILCPQFEVNIVRYDKSAEQHCHTITNIEPKDVKDLEDDNLQKFLFRQLSELIEFQKKFVEDHSKFDKLMDGLKMKCDQSKGSGYHRQMYCIMDILDNKEGNLKLYYEYYRNHGMDFFGKEFSFVEYAERFNKLYSIENVMHELERLRSLPPRAIIDKISAELLVDHDILRFNISGKEVFPVELSSYKTINLSFAGNKEAVLYSTNLNTGVLLVIKNFNYATEKYDNIVTMTNFCLANLTNKEHVKKELDKVFKDFTSSNGALNDKTSIQIFGGALQDGQEVGNGRGILKEALTEKYPDLQFKEHGSSTNIVESRQSCEIFIDRQGTQILRSEGADQTKSLLTKESPTMTQEFMEGVQKNLSGNGIYANFTRKRNEHGYKGNNAPLIPMAYIATIIIERMGRAL